MTITLELPPDLEARFVAEAEAKGVPVSEIVKDYLYHSRPVRSLRLAAAEELEATLDDAADLIPEGVQPLADEAISRESIYTREDDWNR